MKRNILLPPPKKYCNTVFVFGSFFSSSWFFPNFLDETKIIQRKLDQNAHFKKEDLFNLISGNFLTYFEGEDAMVSWSWQYYVNGRCVKGNICRCLEKIFRSKTHVFCNTTKIWFFPLGKRKKMGAKKHRCEGLVWVSSKLFREFVMEVETILRSSYLEWFAFLKVNCLLQSNWAKLL